tara:strand:- start:251 stop:487 length:237 start_codon:yes stop_codon:yes gene_type:complete
MILGTLIEENHSAMSVEICEDKCLMLDICFAFTYWIDSCFLWSSHTHELHYEGSTSGKEFYVVYPVLLTKVPSVKIFH